MIHLILLLYIVKASFNVVFRSRSRSSGTGRILRIHPGSGIGREDPVGSYVVDNMDNKSRFVEGRFLVSKCHRWSCEIVQSVDGQVVVSVGSRL